MDFDRDWTSFALDAEVDAYGTARIAQAHNRLRRRLQELEGERSLCDDCGAPLSLATLRPAEQRTCARCKDYAELRKRYSKMRQKHADLYEALKFQPPGLKEGAKIGRVILFEEQIGDPGGTLHPRQLKVRRVDIASDGTFSIEVEK